MVVDDPDVLFEIEEVNSGTPIIMTGVGLNENLLSGTNNGFVSGWTLNNASVPAAGSTIQMKMIQLVQRRDNVPGLAQRWIVKINNHDPSLGKTWDVVPTLNELNHFHLDGRSSCRNRGVVQRPPRDEPVVGAAQEILVQAHSRHDDWST